MRVVNVLIALISILKRKKKVSGKHGIVLNVFVQRNEPFQNIT